MLIWHSAISLKGFVSSRIFLVESLGFLCIASFHMQMKIIVSLSICILLLSSCYLTVQLRFWSTIVNRYGKNGQPCLFLIIVGKLLSFFLFMMMLAVGLLYFALIMLRYIPWIHNLSRNFIMKGSWMLANMFSTFETPVPYIGYILLSWCSKKFHETPNHGYCQVY